MIPDVTNDFKKVTAAMQRFGEAAKQTVEEWSLTFGLLSTPKYRQEIKSSNAIMRMLKR